MSPRQEVGLSQKQVVIATNIRAQGQLWNQNLGVNFQQGYLWILPLVHKDIVVSVRGKIHKVCCFNIMAKSNGVNLSTAPAVYHTSFLKYAL